MDVLSTGGVFLLWRIGVPFPLISWCRKGERTDDLAQTLVDHRTSVLCRASATLLAKPRHAQGISAQLAMWTRPAPCDVTFTRRWRQRSERHRASNLLRGSVGR